MHNKKNINELVCVYGSEAKIILWPDDLKQIGKTIHLGSSQVIIWVLFKQELDILILSIKYCHNINDPNKIGLTASIMKHFLFPLHSNPTHGIHSKCESLSPSKQTTLVTMLASNVIIITSQFHKASIYML